MINLNNRQSISAQIKELNKYKNHIDNVLLKANVCKDYIDNCKIRQLYSDRYKIVANQKDLNNKINDFEFVFDNVCRLYICFKYTFEHSNGVKYSIYSQPKIVFYFITYGSLPHIFYNLKINKLFKKIKKNQFINEQIIMESLAKYYINICNKNKFSLNFKQQNEKDILYMHYFQKYLNIC